MRFAVMAEAIRSYSHTIYAIDGLDFCDRQTSILLKNNRWVIASRCCQRDM